MSENNSSEKKSTDIKLEKWDARKYLKCSLKQWSNFACCITGMSRSGKSFMLKHLLQIIPKYDFVVICSKTIQNGFYDFIETPFKYTYVADNVINQLKNTYYESEKKFKTLVIIDDMADSHLKYENTISELFVSSRHWECSIVVLVQKCSLLSTTWMANTTIFICLYSGSLREKQYLAQNIVANVLNATSRDVDLKTEEKKAVNLITDTCQNYNALVVLPMDNLIYTYKAK